MNTGHEGFEGETRAAKMWEAERKFVGLECEMEDILPDGWENYTHDWYDSSVELYGIDRELTSGELDALASFGFGQVWTHSEKWPRGDGERHNKERNRERHYPAIWKRTAEALP